MDCGISCIRAGINSVAKERRCRPIEPVENLHLHRQARRGLYLGISGFCGGGGLVTVQRQQKRLDDAVFESLKSTICRGRREGRPGLWHQWGLRGGGGGLVTV